MGDILDHLKSWRSQIVQDKRHREAAGELPEVDIDYLDRAIAEIERLRALVTNDRSAKSRIAPSSHPPVAWHVVVVAPDYHDGALGSRQDCLLSALFYVARPTWRPSRQRR